MAAPPMTARLEVRDPSVQEPRVIELSGTRLVIGRSSKADIQLDRETVSRQHAELTADPFGRWWLRDLGSRNGVQVNGRAVPECLLRAGDVAAIGGFELRLAGEPDGSSGDRTISATVISSDAAVGEIIRLEQTSAARISAGHLSALMAFGERLAGIDDAQVRRQALCQLVIETQFRGLTAAMLSVDRRQPAAAVEVLSSAGPEGAGASQLLHISRTLLGAMLDRNEPVLASNVRGGGSAGGIELSIVSSARPVAAIACPLHAQGDRLDVLYVMLPPDFAGNEWLALVAFAARHYLQAEAAWKARCEAEAHAAIEVELEHARRIQMQLIPRQFAVPGLDIAIGYEPCRWVGGDYVDIVRAADSTLLVLADVCGKGLPAALVSTSLQAIIHTSLRRIAGGEGAGRSVSPADLADLLGSVNEYLCAHLADGSFVTLVGVLADTKARRFSYVNAGHPPAFLLGQGDAARAISGDVPSHPPLGIVPIQFDVADVPFAPGEMLALYTDGLTDVANPTGDMLGMDRLGQTMGQAWIRSGGSAGPMAGELSAAIDSFRQGCLPSDDRSFLLIRREA